MALSEAMKAVGGDTGIEVVGMAQEIAAAGIVENKTYKWLLQYNHNCQSFPYPS